MNKKSPQNKVRVELSKNEASYIQGMLAAYKQNLQVGRNPDNSVISEEIRKAEKMERKFLAA